MSTLDPMRLIQAATPVPPGQAPPAAAVDEQGRSFQDVFQDFVRQVDQTQHQYQDAITAVQKGDVDNLHQVMLAQSQAQISLKLAVEVRNKLVDAYKDVMRTQF